MTDGSSWSMEKFVTRKIEVEERTNCPGNTRKAVRNLSRKILMRQDVENEQTYTIVEYLKDFLTPA